MSIKIQTPFDQAEKGKGIILPFNERKSPPFNNTCAQSSNPSFRFCINDDLSDNNKANQQLPLQCMHSVLPFKKRKRFRFVNITEVTEPTVTIPERRPTKQMYLRRKKVTQSDADRNQHRFQLTAKDVLSNGSNEFFALGKRAMDSSKPLDVNVRDGMGNVYKMVFKYVASSGTFRLMGSEYTDFLKNTGLRQGQLIDIWGSCSSLDDDDGAEIWITLINYDE